MRYSVLVALVAAALVGAGASRGEEAKRPEEKVHVEKVKKAKRARAVKTSGCPDAKSGLRFYRSRYAEHMTAMGRALPEFEGAVSCDRHLYLAKRFRVRARAAREALFRWKYELKDFVVEHGNQAWLRAVREVQKVYPGTESWLLSCSASEGGWGRWVPNSQGSGVGGWLQFYPSTFWRMFDAAQEDMASRGYNVPASAASWYSPLGQALAGAWGLTHGRRGEWMGSGC